MVRGNVPLCKYQLHSDEKTSHRSVEEKQRNRVCLNVPLLSHTLQHAQHDSAHGLRRTLGNLKHHLMAVVGTTRLVGDERHTQDLHAQREP